MQQLQQQRSTTRVGKYEQSARVVTYSVLSSVESAVRHQYSVAMSPTRLLLLLLPMLTGSLICTVSADEEYTGTAFITGLSMVGLVTAIACARHVPDVSVLKTTIC